MGHFRPSWSGLSRLSLHRGGLIVIGHLGVAQSVLALQTPANLVEFFHRQLAVLLLLVILAPFIGSSEADMLAGTKPIAQAALSRM
jgi:hypothetical protein